MTDLVATCVLPAENHLGESPIWCEWRQRLFWVDTRAPLIWWFDPASGGHGTVPLPEMVGSIAFVAGEDRLLAALETAFWLVDLDTGALDRLASPGDVPAGHRFNDGRVDRAGRFWCGTMNTGDRSPTGSLYRLDPDGRVERFFNGIVVPNSTAWSPDGRRMYFADTYRYQIQVFDFDLEAGRLGPDRVLVDLTGRPGRPDGSTVDAEGCLWNAEYNGGRVVRYRPDGTVDRVVSLPVRNATCCAFGGPALDTLYITTAWQRLTPEERAEQPLAGGLFAVKPGVVGLPEQRFGPLVAGAGH